MRRFLNIPVIFAVLALLLPTLAFAQETTGSISGTVTDPSNKPVSFATVSIRSSSGERQVTTDEDGRFLVAFLSPGAYTIAVSADGYGTITDEGVTVGLGSRTSRKYVLQPIMEEAVTVEAPEQAPEPVISDLQSSSSGANISSELAESIPLPRNIANVVFLTPNVKSGGGTGASNPSISGSSGFENQYVFDGVNVTNAGYGALGAFSNVYGSQGTGINFNFVKETQVLTNGFAAEFGQATGGIINLVTRSGSNEWEGSVYGYFTPEGTQASFKVPDLVGSDVAPVLGVDRMDYGFDVGGPIIKDKLFFWVGANPGQVTTTRRTPFVDDDGDGTADYLLYYDGNQELTADSLTWSGKLTIQPTPDHRIDLSAFGDPRETDYSFNRGGSALLADNKDRYTKIETAYENLALNYHGTITPKLLVEATIANAKNTFEEFLTPAGDQWAGSDITALQAATGGSFVLGGIGFTEPMNESNNTQISAKFTSLIGDHEIKYGAGYEDITYDFTTEYTGPQITTRGPDGAIGTADDELTETGVTYQRRLDCSLLGVADVQETVYVDDQDALVALNCPDLDGDGVREPQDVPVVYRVTRGQISEATRETDSQYTYAFIQDTWSTTPNVHINFGLRYEKQRISGNQLAYGFPSTLSPRIGVSWDHTHEGKAKLYGSWGRFYEKVPLDMAVRALSEEISLFRGVYFDSQLSQEVPQGVGVGTRYLTSGTGVTELVGGTENSYTDGMSAGYERDLGKGWSLTTEWQWRKLGEVLEDFSNVPGSDIALGYNTFGHYIIGNIPPNEPIDNSGGGISNAYYPSAERDYQSLTVTGTHRSEKWYFTAQYVLSHLHGNYEGLFRNDNGQSDPNLTSLYDFPNEEMFYYTFLEGSLNTNRTHRLQTYGYYDWSNGWSLGARFLGQSGTPKQRLASHPVYENGGEISLERRGALGDTGFEYNLDLNVKKKWTLPTNFASSVELSVDFFNVLNRGYATGWDFDNDNGVNLDTCTVDPLDPTCATLEQQYERLVESVANGVPNPDYGKAVAYSAPREVRFGVKWQF